jgi:hypothetical protein
MEMPRLSKYLFGRGEACLVGFADVSCLGLALVVKQVLYPGPAGSVGSDLVS